MQGGGARLSPGEFYGLLLQSLSADGSVDTVFVMTSFPTAVERASCKVHKLLCIGCLDPTTLTPSRPGPYPFGDKSALYHLNQPTNQQNLCFASWSLRGPLCYACPGAEKAVKMSGEVKTSNI